MASIAVVGASGRMGRTVIELAQNKGHEVVFAVDREQDRANGVEIRPGDEFEQLIDGKNPDAVIDFTAPEAALDYAEVCSEHCIPFVTGTTGFSEKQLQILESYSSDTPVLRASNFSQGIQALRRALKQVVAALPEYDIEVVETHHNGKADSPSGTAKTLVDDIETVRGESKRVHGREGEAPRTGNEIGVHAVRAGDVHGEHKVILAGNQEVVTLKHRSESRKVFASGALSAAEWIQGREPGFYRFEEVISRQ